MRKPPQRVILMSSLAASGPSIGGRPLREDDPCRPVSHYGLSKLQAEKIALSFAERIPIVVLRPPAVYGPRDRDILAFFRVVQKGWNLTIGRGELLLSMIHVRDLVEGVLLAAQRDVDSGSVFFLSDGHIYRWEEVVAHLERIMDVRVITLPVPFFLAHAVAGFAEVLCRVFDLPPLLHRQKVLEMKQKGWICDISKATESLGFMPGVSLEDGLRETYHWYLGQGWI